MRKHLVISSLLLSCWSLATPRDGVFNVKDFGALGDGTTDDTAAFQRALQKAGGKTVLIPPGRYVITDILEITTSP